MTGGLLPGADRDLVNILAKRIEKLFEQDLPEHQGHGMNDAEDGVAVTFEGRGADTRAFDRVLVSIGRRPNSQDPWARDQGRRSTSAASSSPTEPRTASRRIYAIGDVAGEPMLAHKATHEGASPSRRSPAINVAFAPAAIPAVVFTDPEIAWCGLTETEAEKQGPRSRSREFPWAASGPRDLAGPHRRRHQADRRPGEPARARRRHLRPRRGELISEGVLAVEMGAPRRTWR